MLAFAGDLSIKDRSSRKIWTHGKVYINALLAYVPGSTCDGIDSEFSERVHRYNMVQHVDGPAHDQGNTLDLILTTDIDAKCLSQVQTHDTCFSDHSLFGKLSCPFILSPALKQRNFVMPVRLATICSQLISEIPKCLTFLTTSLLIITFRFLLMLLAVFLTNMAL